MLGTKEYRKTLDTQFKNEKSNFKIGFVIDYIGIKTAMNKALRHIEIFASVAPSLLTFCPNLHSSYS